MEVFPEVRAIIDLNIFKDKANEALNIIQSGKSIEKCKNYGNSYEVIDSFEKINDIHTQLLKLKMRPSAAEPTRSSRTETSRFSGAKSTRSSGTESIRPSDDNATRPSEFNSARSPDAESARSSSHFELPVNETILNYIREIYGSKLQKLEKDFDVSIKMNPSGDNNVTVQYTSNKNGSVSRGATDSFLTLYQQVATNLKMEMIKNPGRRTIKKDTGASLQKKFPKVLLIPKETEFIIMGEPADVSSYAHILKSELDQLDSYSMPDATNSKRRPPSSSEYKSKMYSASASKLEAKGEDSTCPICLEEIEDRETLKKCKHSFCKDCINVAFKTKSACPICGELYGEIIGTQPEGGRMSSRNMPMSLPGYEKFETIEIHYTIPDGIQGAEHPHPGQRYYGTTRTAYLPDNAEGRKVYKLLRRAFEQRLIFTVGTSSTTGRSNVVTWNDVHHKTNTMGGPSMFGYPDPTYLARVQDELKAKGIY
ncbi:E3 ubiquitin-protein ligase DTX3L [Chiloscyllium plagiosum]|uniref:E3 ubiquitin-protein ligase DTX3L n=1 Tax=Chiloscyllium plagiosum TaxID=36176 RepID=UPI001CB8725B|nr:E3 ubiquitin-protein ligase DTX3L [Chiloscyllium plagiosum]